MKKLRILFAIPCLALTFALVGCGGSESTFVPAETDPSESAEAMNDAYSNPGEGDPRGEAPATPDPAPAPAEGDTPAAP